MAAWSQSVSRRCSRAGASVAGSGRRGRCREKPPTLGRMREARAGPPGGATSGQGVVGDRHAREREACESSRAACKFANERSQITRGRVNRPPTGAESACDRVCAVRGARGGNPDPSGTPRSRCDATKESLARGRRALGPRRDQGSPKPRNCVASRPPLGRARTRQAHPHQLHLNAPPRASGAHRTRGHPAPLAPRSPTHRPWPAPRPPHGRTSGGSWPPRNPAPSRPRPWGPAGPGTMQSTSPSRPCASASGTGSATQASRGG